MLAERHLWAAAAAGSIALLIAVAPASGGGQRSAGAGARVGVFTHPTRISNRWLPLRPGNEYVYTGSERFGSRRVHHRVVFIVTDLTKVIGRVRTRVVWDRDYDSGKLIEGELAFDAQDDAGNVWLFGEYPEQYRRGRLTGAPDTWIAGVSGAKRGLAMQASPRTGTRSYSQGRAPAIGFADRARVERTGQRNCVPAGCFGSVLVIEEWSPDEPAARQLKYYAPRIGSIRVGFSGGGQQEGLVLVRVRRLAVAEREQANAEALAIDHRGYRVSPRVYARTRPAVDP